MRDNNTTSAPSASTAAKADILWRFFIGREDVYAIQQANGNYYPEEESLTQEVHLRHCEGKRTVGIYLLKKDGSVTLGALDYDARDPRDFKAKKAYMQEAVLFARRWLAQFNVPSHIEFSGRKGYHQWLLLKSPAPAAKVRRILTYLAEHTREELGDLGFTIETFPKQDIAAKTGNLIKLPWGRHRKTGTFTYFVDENFKRLPDDGVESLEASPPVTEGMLDAIIAGLPEPKRETPPRAPVERSEDFNALAVAKLLESCAFMQHCHDDAQSLSEPDWWGMIHQLAPFGEAGEREAHRLSQSYPQYTEEETQQKIDAAKKALEGGIGPHTCSTIQKDLSFVCPPDCSAVALAVASPAGMASKLASQEVTEEPLPLAMPELGEGVWQGLFGQYRDLVANTTEASDAYHYGCFALALGVVLARRLSVHHARPLFPNFYVCLVGRTAITRKDTAESRARTLVLRLHEDEQNLEDLTKTTFRFIPGIGSAEGLMTALEGHRKVVLLNEAEFLSLLAKGRQQAVSNLIPKLAVLYDCPPYDTLVTKKNRIEAFEPFLSIMCGTTHAWLQQALTEWDVRGGFANRFMFICGRPKAPMAYPQRMSTARLNAILGEINAVRMWADGQWEKDGGELIPTEEARELFAEFYAEYHKRCGGETLGAELIVRVQEFVWKLALLYAAIERSRVIEARHLEAAILAGDFLERSALHVFQGFATSRGRQIEDELLAFLRERGRGAPVPQREVYRTLRISAEELEKASRPLLRLGVLRNRIISTRGRSVKCFELV